MTDAVEAVSQDMEEEAADELVRCEGHDALPLGTHRGGNPCNGR